MPRPVPGTYPVYFDNYIKQVPEDDLYAAFKGQEKLRDDFFSTITDEKADYAYAPGKWTLKEMLQHIIDAERIFSFRALSFARNESQSLPGFDENEYAAHSNAGNRSWLELVSEFQAVRKSTELLYKSFSPETLQVSGLANNKETSVNALGFITIGHLYHHCSVIESRYLLETPL